jgi:gamma-glutamyl-gamma-aminobutyrate hydrolase PuuD
LVQRPTLLVNTFHREAIAELTQSVVASAQSDDGVIEAIEIPTNPSRLACSGIRSCSRTPTMQVTACFAV